MNIDPHLAFARTLEREEALRTQLQALLIALDSAPVGPASAIIPRWQLDRIEAAIENSEEETAMLDELLGDEDATG